MGSISTFMDQNFKHFNARETREAAIGWRALLDGGGEMLVTLAGAMSSAELGISLAKMIRARRVHAISTTAANLEEDVFNLFAHNEYKVVSHYWDLAPEDEVQLANDGFNRVTDTCIPETVMRHTESLLLELWQRSEQSGKPKFPCEYWFDLLDHSELQQHYQIPPEHSWVLAAKEMGIPVYSPGWEDSTLGNMFCAHAMKGDLKGHSAVRSGTEQMQCLARWYLERVERSVPIGFFQIGGGIAGDFPICVVPMLRQDMNMDIPHWSYFAQISDSTTSYGSYSGAVPNEKITWHKLGVETPKYMINSDASIVAPLIFAYVLGE